MTVPASEALRARLGAALAEGPPLKLAVLFGSRATRRARAGSDVDVGIIPGGAAQLRDRYASMDAARLWAELPSGTAAFTDFAAAISAFLQRAP